MRQLRIREPWAELVQGSNEEAVQDLVVRVQVLEKRIRDLEALLGDRLEEEVKEREPAGV